MRKHPEESEILAGGQGRDVDEIIESAAVLEWLLLVLLTSICVLILGGCARPSAYVPCGDTQTGGQDARGPRAAESSASERADRPQWDELRQQFGGL